MQNLKEEFGFISPKDGEGSNLFFFHPDIFNADFADLRAGDTVKYEIGHNEKEACAKNIIVSSCMNQKSSNRC